MDPITIITIIAITIVSLYAYHDYNQRSCCKKKLPPAPITLIDSSMKYALKLIEKKEINHDTKRFRFELPSKKHCLGLPVGQYVYLTTKVDGKLIVRAYTPVTSDDDLGYVDMLIKVYHKDKNTRFPKGGKMTLFMENMAIGDTIDFRGPAGLIIYEGNGLFELRANKRTEPIHKTFKYLSMIAGGTGITPMLQIIADILQHPNDRTKVKLLFANQTEDDILCRNELDELASKHPDQLCIWYTLDKPKSGWKYSKGFITDAMIKEHLYPPSEDAAVFLSGPPPMIKFSCMPSLDRLNYDPNNRFLF